MSATENAGPASIGLAAGPCSCGGTGTCEHAENLVGLPVDPYTALRVTYGMLLGVHDFETLMGNPRGKGMLHGGWLHSGGVVWGLDVRVSTDGHRYELNVHPGLALDHIGRELHVDVVNCIDPARWLAAELASDGGYRLEGAEASTARVRGYVRASFVACPARLVPALADPCDPGRQHTTHSRLHEAARLEFVPFVPGKPSPPPAHSPVSYPRLRVLFGLERPDYGSELTEWAELAADIRALPALEQPQAMLAAFRRAAAVDVTEIAPPGADRDGRPATAFPVAEEDAGIPLAVVDLGFRRSGDQWTTENIKVDAAARPVHVATGALQELLCGPVPPVRAGDDAGGPRVIASSARITSSRTVEFQLTAPLARASLRDAVSVMAFGRSGWSGKDLDNLHYHRAGPGQRHPRVVVLLGEDLDAPLARLVVRGTGPRPVLGLNLVPLAGLDTDRAPGSASDGHDAAILLRVPGRRFDPAAATDAPEEE